MTLAIGAPASGALSGVRILDLSINVLGPVATQSLGDMGADVIKIEIPQGDPMRGSGPSRNPGMAAFFLNLNRNKKSVVLDLKKPAAFEAMHRLIGTADVLVHSMRAKAAERLSLDYATLAKSYPRLIYASAPGYSPDGPYRDRPAYDDVIQGESGLADLMQMATSSPRYLPTIEADKLCGVFLASAIGMALFSRERTGLGQQVHVPMLETMLSFNLIEHLFTGVFGDEGQIGYGRPVSPHRKPYATKDGFICVLANSDEQWRRMFKLFSRDELASDPRFATFEARTKNIDALYTIVAEQISQRTTNEWCTLLDEADMPNGPVNRLKDLPNNPYLMKTGFFQQYEHPSEGSLVTTAIPQRFSLTPASIRLPPPRLGEHTNEVLQASGYDDAGVARIGHG